MPSEMASMVGSDGLFLYFGHGSGEAFLPRDLARSKEALPAALLFGCSSGRLQPAAGPFSLTGCLLSFLHGASPLVLCNLWDVTDRDIDRLTVAFLTEAGIVDSRLPLRTPIGEAVGALARGRECCSLRLLNGAAPVIYI